MKAALLALVTVGALAVSASSADARPPRGHYGGYHGGGYHSGYRGYYGGWRSYYGGYSPYYGGYYPGVSVGGFGLTVGNGYTYPYYTRPYYGGYRYGWAGRRW